MIKARRMRWARHVARMRKKRNAYTILVESQMERDHSQDQYVGGRIFRGVNIDGVRIGDSDLLTISTHDSETTSNYSATANLHNSQITTAPA
jgi:hypothetical protein